MNNTTKMLLTVGAGLVVGAAIGILFAPEEGTETRRKIAKRTKKLVGSVNDSIEDGKESLEDIKNVLHNQLNKVNKKLEEIKL